MKDHYHEKVSYDIFCLVIASLEKYIEVAYQNEFPNWQKQKQICDNTIKRTDLDGHSEKAEELIAYELLILWSNLGRKKKDLLREKITEEYYKWIDAVKINANNCPKRLKHFLLGIHETIEKGDEKVRKDINKWKSYPEDENFIKEELEDNKQESLEDGGEKRDEVTIESRFEKGNAERGKETFAEIVKTITDYDKFYFVSQQEDSPSQQGESRKKPKEVIQSVKSSISPSLSQPKNSQGMSGETKVLLEIIGIETIILLFFIAREVVKSKKNHHE